MRACHGEGVCEREGGPRERGVGVADGPPQADSDREGFEEIVIEAGEGPETVHVAAKMLLVLPAGGDP